MHNYFTEYFTYNTIPLRYNFVYKAPQFSTDQNSEER